MARKSADWISYILSSIANPMLALLAVLPSVFIVLAVNEAVLSPLGLTPRLGDPGGDGLLTMVVPGVGALVLLGLAFVGLNRLILKAGRSGSRRGGWPYWTFSGLLLVGANVTFFVVL
jgi:hypothetical protein